MSDRETPYDLIFRRGRLDFEGERFPAIREEAESRGMPLDDPERFVMLGSVGALMREMILDEDAADESGEIWQALPADAISQTGALLYHAYHFADAGCPVHELDEAEARDLTSAPPGLRIGPARFDGEIGVGRTRADADEIPPLPLRAPGPAGYVQLPKNLFWARPADDAAAEPIDGFFWATAGGRLDILFALGVRASRPGFTSIPLQLELEDGDVLPEWIDNPTREDGADFSNILPGGDIDELLGVTSRAEALRLAALCLHHVATRPDG